MQFCLNHLSERVFHFHLWWFFKEKTLLQQTPWANYLTTNPYNFGGCSQPRVFQQKHRSGTWDLASWHAPWRRRFVAVGFLGKKGSMVKWPFKGLTDLQLGNQKVTLNHLVEICVCGRFLFFLYSFRKRGSKLKLSRTGVFPLCRYVCPYIFADIIFVSEW